MLQALGYKFLDKNNTPVSTGAGVLSDIVSINNSQILPELSECSFRIACDVNNPLCGENGATYIFGPQKGLSTTQLPVIDAAMQHYANVVAEYFGTDYSTINGAGAAGGLGFAFLAFLNVELVSGVDLILNAIHLEDELSNADYILTGEGMLDHQTAMGKVPIGVARLISAQNIH